MNDSEIYVLLQKNAERGFSLLFRKYYKSLVIYAHGILQELEPSEDLVQDLFFKLLKGEKLHAVSPDKWKSYLFVAARNSAINHLTSKREYARLESLPEPIDDFPEERLYDEHVIGEIKTQISLLPPRTRDIVTDVLIGNKPYKEVADRYSISVNTVKMLLSRGLKKIRAALGDDDYHLFVLYIFTNGR